MPAIDEVLDQYDCQRHGRKSYEEAVELVNLVRRKHKHYDVVPRQEGDNRIIQIDPFLRAKREQASMVKQIKDALRDGDATLARRLATEGAQRYPMHHDLQDYARLLAPPRIVQNNVPPNSSVRANHTWLKTHRHEYRGDWIGVRNGELVGVDNSLENLIQKIGETKGVLLTKA